MFADLGLLILCGTPICICICITVYKCTKVKYQNIQEEGNDDGSNN